MPEMNAHARADHLMLEQGLCESRAQAKQLIEAGYVHANGLPVDKVSRRFSPDTRLSLSGSLPYVSRAGEKLAHALDTFGIDVTNYHALDVGASTGGFTDCLLKRKAAHVTCIDVGHGQLHPSLRDDPRVANFEGLHARDLASASLPYANYACVVADLSFISLTAVLSPMWIRLAPGGTLICLIKPQFEAGPQALNRKGIVRDAADREASREKILAYANANLLHVKQLGSLDSPISGGDGNREYLAAWQKQAQD